MSASPSDSHPFRGIGLIVGLGVLLAVGVSPLLHAPGLRTDPTPDSLAFAGDPAAVERGNALFQANCAACHGPEGKGDGPAAASLEPKPIDFTAPIHRGHGDAYLANAIANGVAGSAMPAFAGQLTDAEIGDVVTFVRSLQAKVAAEQGLNVPAPEECNVAPRSPREFLPTGTPTPKPFPTPQPNVGPDSFPWPRGEPASDEEVAGVTRTIREFHACANAGDYARRLALYTDRAIRPQFAALDATGWQATLDLAATPPSAVSPGDRGWIAAVSEVRRLPDGRVGAYVQAVDPVNHPHEINTVVVFAWGGDRWLIDEVHSDPIGNLGVPMTPTPGQALPVAGVRTPVTSGGLLLTVLEATTEEGIARIELALFDVANDPIDDATVELTLDMPSMEMAVQRVPAASTGAGRYEAAIPLPMSGAWQATISVTRGNGEPILFRITFSLP